jgi:hypothetical protein
MIPAAVTLRSSTRRAARNLQQVDNVEFVDERVGQAGECLGEALFPGHGCLSGIGGPPPAPRSRADAGAELDHFAVMRDAASPYAHAA